jgi:hypothetical protein
VFLLEDVAPINNAAEQVLRPAILWRKGCFGIRSPAGSRFVGVAVAAEMTSIGKNLLLVLNRDAQTAHDVGIGSSASVGS